MRNYSLKKNVDDSIQKEEIENEFIEVPVENKFIIAKNHVIDENYQRNDAKSIFLNLKVNINILVSSGI